MYNTRTNNSTIILILLLIIIILFLLGGYCLIKHHKHNYDYRKRAQETCQSNYID